MSTLAIIQLVLALAPKLIDAGTSVIGLWDEARSLLGKAEAGTATAEDEARLKALVQKQLDQLAAYAQEAKSNPAATAG